MGIWKTRKLVSMQTPPTHPIQSLPVCLTQIKVYVIVLFSHGLNFSSASFKKASA